MKLSDYNAKPHAKEEADLRKLLLKVLKNYEGKSEKDVMAEIVSTARAKREAGALSDEELKRFYDMLCPLVNSEQKQKLDEIYVLLK